MSGYSFKEIKKHYANMSDAQLVRIATTKAQDLRPGVFGVIEAEVKKRNLNPDIMEAVHAQNRDYSLAEIHAYSEFIRVLPCPFCHSTRYKLNGTMTYSVKSFLFFSVFHDQRIIACPACLDKKNNDAIISTLFMGWWGVPEGLLKTPWSIYRNVKSKKLNKTVQANDVLLSFAGEHIGQIELYKHEPAQLSLLIHKESIGGMHLL